MKLEFKALVKEYKAKALVSLDKGHEVKLQGGSSVMADLAKAPADKEVNVIVEWSEEDGDGTPAQGI